MAFFARDAFICTCKKEECDLCNKKYFDPVTNADRIRAMTDEELAVFLGRIIQSTMVGYAAIADKTNEKNAVLIHGWLEWLKQGASE